MVSDTLLFYYSGIPGLGKIFPFYLNGDLGSIVDNVNVNPAQAWRQIMPYVMHRTCAH